MCVYSLQLNILNLSYKKSFPDKEKLLVSDSVYYLELIGIIFN